jgi:hypothetical protein
MVRVSTLISVCTRIQATRSRKPTRPRVITLSGTKASASSAIAQSAANISQVATTSSSTRVTDCIIPFWMNIRVPSRSIMPRVIRSPEWILS